MEILGFAGQKGGSGKTTLSISVADELYRREHDVLLLDCDPQGSTATWKGNREDPDDGPDVVAADKLLTRKPSEAKGALESYAEGYEYIVIDPPPGNATEQLVLLALVDKALIPCQTGLQDLWSLSGTLDRLAQVAQKRPSLEAHLVANRVDRTVLTRSVREALEDAPFPPLESFLSDLVAFRECLAEGLGVTRYAPDSKASQQTQELVDEILSL